MLPNTDPCPNPALCWPNAGVPLGGGWPNRDPPVLAAELAAPAGEPNEKELALPAAAEEPNRLGAEEVGAVAGATEEAAAGWPKPPAVEEGAAPKAAGCPNPKPPVGAGAEDAAAGAAAGCPKAPPPAPLTWPNTGLPKPEGSGAGAGVEEAGAPGTASREKKRKKKERKKWRREKRKWAVAETVVTELIVTQTHTV